MSSPAFERLLYTDCLAGQGRRGTNGFQIQAQSAGVDGEQERLAVDSLLYAIQDAWTAQRRPVEEFPLGFAHACGAGYGTAQSRYLGQEAMGGRQGNHLADCILSRDPLTYGAVRPAQLWRAELWRDTPWSHTTCPPFEDYLEPGPLDHDAVADWAGKLPDSSPLAKLLTVLEDPAGRNVIVLADEPDEVMPWIAAATMLLPIRAALEVSFKVFVDRLAYAGQRICAAPRELNPRVTPAGSQDHRFVLDAATGSCGEQGISPRAAFWVTRLLTADDPYDVVEAVELAEAIGGQDGVIGEDARYVAWALVAPDDPIETPAALVRWLQGADSSALREHGSRVVSAVLTQNPDSRAVRAVDRVVSAGSVLADAAQVRRALLAAEIEEARGSVAPDGGPLALVDVGDQALRDAESSIASAVLNASSDASVDALLQVAGRHGVELPTGVLVDRLDSFVASWVDTPAADYLPQRWALREQLIDLLHQHLSDRYDRLGAEAIRPAVRQLWPVLLSAGSAAQDPVDPLSWQARAGALESARSDHRAAVVQEAVDEIGRARDAYRAAEGLQQALLDWGQVHRADALVIAANLPVSLPLTPGVADSAIEAVLARSTPLDETLLQALHALDARGHLPLDARLNHILDSDRSVLQVVRRIKAVIDAEDRLERLRDPLTLMQDADPAVIAARSWNLLVAAVQCPQKWTGSVLLQFMPVTAGAAFLSRWSEELPNDRTGELVALGVLWSTDEALPEVFRDQIGDEIRSYLSDLEPGEVSKVGQLVFGRQGRRVAGAWAALLAEPAPQRRRGLFQRGARNS